MSEEIRISPIGFVKVINNRQMLVINKEFIEAMDGLDGFSHINVLWWCNLFDNSEYRNILTSEQPYKNAPEKLGIFATRAPIRPNPVALTTVSLIGIDKKTGEIHVDYIDAEEGTPIIDIKPYYPCSDRVKNVTTPEWSSGWPAWREDSAHFDWSSVFINAR
ncbi:MAG: SAM-dependent methyltransferase [Clostridia bacterium]|nr:SAM-dependent methyltransferase [Clostridia bacterium]